MKEQIEAENSLNVFELAKFYYLKRPGIWRNHVRQMISCFIFNAIVFL